MKYVCGQCKQEFEDTPAMVWRGDSSGDNVFCCGLHRDEYYGLDKIDRDPYEPTPLDGVLERFDRDDHS